MTSETDLSDTLYVKLKPAGVLSKPLKYQDLEKEINEVMAKAWGAQKPASILVVDDVRLIRKAVIKLVQPENGRIIINEATNGQEAVDICQRINPDIILMDVDMPGMNGIEAATTIRKKNNTVKIIMLTAYDTDSHIFDAFAAGADGYVLKNRFAETLPTAIQTVRLDSVWLDPSIAREILAFSGRPANEPAKLNELLSAKEVNTLSTVAQCTGELCLVDPSFVARLHKLSSAA